MKSRILLSLFNEERLVVQHAEDGFEKNHNAQPESTFNDELSGGLNAF